MYQMLLQNVINTIFMYTVANEYINKINSLNEDVNKKIESIRDKFNVE